jgi:hypothetical protein
MAGAVDRGAGAVLVMMLLAAVAVLQERGTRKMGAGVGMEDEV